MYSLIFGKRKKFEINNADVTYKVHYLGNVMTSIMKGDGCVDKAVKILWENHVKYNGRAGIKMEITLTQGGLKVNTDTSGVTEYYGHRIHYIVAHQMHPKLFVWVYQHVGRNLKTELRCHAALCKHARDAKLLAVLLNERLERTFAEYKREKRRMQTTRLCNSKNRNFLKIPMRKKSLSSTDKHYKPPVQRSMISAPKLDDVREEEEDEDRIRTQLGQDDLSGDDEMSSSYASRSDNNNNIELLICNNIGKNVLLNEDEEDEKSEEDIVTEEINDESEVTNYESFDNELVIDEKLIDDLNCRYKQMNVSEIDDEQSKKLKDIDVDGMVVTSASQSLTVKTIVSALIQPPSSSLSSVSTNLSTSASSSSHRQANTIEDSSSICDSGIEESFTVNYDLGNDVDNLKQDKDLLKAIEDLKIKINANKTLLDINKQKYKLKLANTILPTHNTDTNSESDNEISSSSHLNDDKENLKKNLKQLKLSPQNSTDYMQVSYEFLSDLSKQPTINDQNENNEAGNRTNEVRRMPPMIKQSRSFLSNSKSSFRLRNPFKRLQLSSSSFSTQTTYKKQQELIQLKQQQANNHDKLLNKFHLIHPQTLSSTSTSGSSSPSTSPPSTPTSPLSPLSITSPLKQVAIIVD